MILRQRAPLQQQLAVGVEGEDGERAVQRSAAMDVQLLAFAQVASASSISTTFSIITEET